VGDIHRLNRIADIHDRIGFLTLSSTPGVSGSCRLLMRQVTTTSPCDMPFFGVDISVDCFLATRCLAPSKIIRLPICSGVNPSFKMVHYAATTAQGCRISYALCGIAAVCVILMSRHCEVSRHTFGKGIISPENYVFDSSRKIVDLWRLSNTRAISADSTFACHQPSIRRRSGMLSCSINGSHCVFSYLDNPLVFLIGVAVQVGSARTGRLI